MINYCIFIGICEELIRCLENSLGYEDNKSAILVGTGNLGKAFLKYKGFEKHGLNIVAGFDADKRNFGRIINGKKIYNISYLPEFMKSHPIRIAILTVPGEVAQEVCNILTQNGIKAIWNFVQIHLDVNDDVVIENVDLAASLSVLSYRLSQKE